MCALRHACVSDVHVYTRSVGLPADFFDSTYSTMQFRRIIKRERNYIPKCLMVEYYPIEDHSSCAKSVKCKQSNFVRHENPCIMWTRYGTCLTGTNEPHTEQLRRSNQKHVSKTADISARIATQLIMPIERKQEKEHCPGRDIESKQASDCLAHRR